MLRRPSLLSAVLLTLTGCGIGGKHGSQPPPPPPTPPTALVGEVYTFGTTGVVQVDDITRPQSSVHSLLANGSGPDQFNRVMMACRDGSGRIYACDTSNHRVARMDSIAGDGWTAFGTHGSGVGQFSFPTGITTDSGGRIWIADSGNARIVRIDDMTGTGWTTCSGDGTHSFSYPNAVQLDGGHLYVSDGNLNQVISINDMTGAGWQAFGTTGSGIGKFNGVEQLALDSSHRIYVSDRVNARIVRIDDLTGAGWASFSGDGGANTLFAPTGVAVDASFRIYIAWGSKLSRCDDMSGSNWVNFTHVFQEAHYITIDRPALPTGIARARPPDAADAIRLAHR